MTRPLARAGLVTASLAAALAVPLLLARRAGLSPGALLRLPWQAHVAGALLFAVEVGARAARLRALAGPLQVPLRPRTALLAQLCADAAGAVTPARGGSEPAKVLTMRRDGGGVGEVGAVALGEMALEVSGLVVVATVLAVAAPGGTRAALAVLTYAAVVGAVLSLLYLAAGRGHDGPPRWLLRLGLPAGAWTSFVGSARAFRERVGALPHIGVRPALTAAALTLLHQGARAATLPGLAWGAQVAGPGSGAGPVPWATLFVVPFGIVYLGALLPPPGGGGGVELGFAALLRDALPPALLPTLLLWWRIYTHYLGALVGGAASALMLLRRRSRPGTEPDPDPR